VRYAEQGFAGDGVQRPLRSRFPPRLKRSVGLQAILELLKEGLQFVNRGKHHVVIILHAALDETFLFVCRATGNKQTFEAYPNVKTKKSEN
jgi:hypothetical protein